MIDKLADQTDDPLDAAELIERARRLVPALRERAVASEKLRRCPDETIADLHESRLLRAIQPKRYGGFELAWDTHCEIVMELSRGCGSQAWVAMVMSDHKYLLGLFGEEAQSEVWEADPDALISSSFAPVGKARRADGGFVLDGRWGFSSGIHHAGWVIAGAMVESAEAGAPPEPCFMLVPASDYRLIDNWHVVGLSGSGSLDFEIHDAFVPAHRVIDIRSAEQGTSPGTKLHRGAVYRMPQKSTASLGLASPSVGIAEMVIEEFTEAARTRVSRGHRIAEWQATQLRIAESAAEVAAARLLILTTARDAMATLAAGDRLTMTQRATAKRNACYGAMICRRAVDRLFEASGGRGLYLDNDLQRGMRDAKAAGAHIALGWDIAGSVNSSMTISALPTLGEASPCEEVDFCVML